MGMTIGACRITLRLPENQSLKGKRKVLKSLISRLHNKFNVAVAEIDSHDSWQTVVIGVTCVSNAEPHASQILSNVMDFVRRERLDAEIVDYQTEMLHGVAE